LLAVPVLEAALETGRFDAWELRGYEQAFRAYFDPAMGFLDLCATVLRNRHLARPWLKALARGCDLAAGDEEFARTGGSYFGGLDVRPFGILTQLWARIAADLALALPRLPVGHGRGGPKAATAFDLVEWQVAWSRSLFADPLWHVRWSMDVQRKTLGVLSTLHPIASDPRAAGPVT
jgi:hypothetical protein